MWPEAHSSRVWWWVLSLYMTTLCREPPAKKPRDADLSVEESGMSDDLVVVEVCQD